MEINADTFGAHDSVITAINRVATSFGEKNSRTFEGHSSIFSRPISATFYCDGGILKVIA